MRKTLAILLAAGLVAATTTARAETLADAVALAYDGNPQLMAQRAQLRAVQEAYNQALASYGPNASLELARTRSRTDVRGVAVDGTADTNQLSVEQPLYLGGAAHAATNLARAQAASGVESQLQAGQQILQSVIAAYAAVRRDEEGVRIARENVAVLQQQLKDTDARFALYEVTITDRSQAAARLAAAQAQLSAREGQLAQSRGDYLALIGQNPGQLTAQPPIANLPATLEEAFERAEHESHTLRIAIYAEQQSQARVEQAKALYRPTVGLQVQSAETPLSTFDPTNTERVTTAAVVLRQTFPINGLARSRVVAAQAQQQRDRLLIDDARRQTVRSVSLAWNQLAAARVALVARRQEVQAQQIAYDSVKEEQRLGLRTVLDVLNAEQELRDAKFGLIETAYQEYVSSAALLGAMGELRFSDFSPGLVEKDTAPRRAFRVPWTGLLNAVDAIAVREPAPLEQTLSQRAVQPDRVLRLEPAQEPAPEP
ncbi:TolC family outer membrane protein [Caulobacter rhizosphaerae]|uniref:TolC family outer membrane protein n=1 Tax=Caulobacter rhizosphaerae TaxID=2010972 RepID=UPI0013D53AF3|nr:TolC family outer membrane protein [Caulobacter rhizosphaerae]